MYGPALSCDRVAEFESVVRCAQAWAGREPDVTALGLAGSWARGAARMDSDADLVVLCRHPGRFGTADGWIVDAAPAGAELIRTAHWGVLVERRLVLPSGFEVEFGFVTVSWADLVPVDEGTARVVRDGFRVLHDPTGVLHRLVAAVR